MPSMCVCVWATDRRGGAESRVLTQKKEPAMGAGAQARQTQAGKKLAQNNNGEGKERRAKARVV